MGIPEYFTLETLYLENVEMTNIKENFFRGLTIKSELRASNYKLCCPQILNPNISVDKCHAPVDVISSCKHLVGDILKRITIWTVGLITVVGNGIVLVYRIGWNREIFKKAYGLFVSGLAVSDFIMGVYLLLIAAVDSQYKDIYVLEDVKWRHSVLCQFAGFLSTISSETSTFFICLITIDRFLTITFPFGQHKFTKTGKIFSFTLVWFFGFLLALIPITSTELNIYSSNVLYFMCWFPVGILGFLSLNGHTFDREVYAWIAVFVMPINSALNPIIYTVPIIIQKCLMQIRL
uniref:G-protein coupled receptors family 1 profile domain-containing protein n=1 Tax=Biomphalaria glabrata TaxID=6526 RepID=A0A2C9KHQ1_BIOGL